MSNANIGFWLALLDKGGTSDQRTWLWNGYIAWRFPLDIEPWLKSETYGSKSPIPPPVDGWPALTKSEKESIDALAFDHGGHPKVGENFMNFSGHTFDGEVDFSDLVLIDSCFENAQFDHTADFRNTRFDLSTRFDKAQFRGRAFFDGASFVGTADYMGTQFSCGCSFSGASFEAAYFNDAQFSERGFPSNICPQTLVDFTNVKFMSAVEFREVVFGDIEPDYFRAIWPERVVDFSGATFASQASFYKATFASAPAFFETTLHEDTNFDSVHWEHGMGTRIRPGYAVRAWERLELMMSQLEKPFDRHRFFRFKMRYRRQLDSPLLCVMNKMFELICDYGWGVQRAFWWWLGHWGVFSLLLFANTGLHLTPRDYWSCGQAALGIGFANGHAFLGLANDGGYLESSRRLLESNDVFGLLALVGTVQSVLGPTLLFLLLLTIRNRFRLA